MEYHITFVRLWYTVLTNISRIISVFDCERLSDEQRRSQLKYELSANIHGDYIFWNSFAFKREEINDLQFLRLTFKQNFVYLRWPWRL